MVLTSIPAEVQLVLGIMVICLIDRGVLVDRNLAAYRYNSAPRRAPVTRTPLSSTEKQNKRRKHEDSRENE